VWAIEPRKVNSVSSRQTKKKKLLLLNGRTSHVDTTAEKNAHEGARIAREKKEPLVDRHKENWRALKMSVSTVADRGGGLRATTTANLDNVSGQSKK